MKSFKILSPCGILGYGFPDASFANGLADRPDAIVVDAGSTDAGPHKLGAKTAIVSRRAAKKDLKRIIEGGQYLKIPVLIGSAGGSGGKSHVQWTLDIIAEILAENPTLHPRTAIIWADIPNELILEKLEQGEVAPLDAIELPLNAQILFETTGVVAQMGVEPILKVLEADADLIVCGRAYDPAPFAAAGIHAGFDIGLSYHLGKVLECGALCCNPGTTKDCMMGVLHDDDFEVYPCDPKRKCSPLSVAAHTFYEKDHPYLLHGPGIEMDLSHCTFTQVGENRVRVQGSRLFPTDPYRIKLEGARKVAYRTFVVAGVRDPILISKIEEVEKLVRESVQDQYNDIDSTSYTVNFMNYGKNGVMGDLEPDNQAGHELCVVFEVLAENQDISSSICASVRSTFMHYGYEGRKATAGNLAFPFAPSDINFGAVYEFSVYHLMSIDDPSALFPWQWWKKGEIF
ncbi:acyclic terpene utilization AtuA family protein [uncultured Sphaerochaeta sp.]|uniref:acyclic terpene utilization AtuA family protein n=1 Tax=uncultured Sphaerochaeta sp. TaxID=886478 RepID=UPI002A0A9094|nr:acyclic terpene utilization AtuA family protein [uncultured Sphaerochaeta sp.]